VLLGPVDSISKNQRHSSRILAKTSTSRKNLFYCHKFPNTKSILRYRYGDGEFLTGSVGLDTVTVGGLSVSGQEIGLVDKAAWNGDGVNSGLLGLAYPDLTSVYNGTDPNADGASNAAPYNPFFFSAIAQKKVDQPSEFNPYLSEWGPTHKDYLVFSVALDRGSLAAQENSTYDSPLGYLAFGGIAPVKVTSTAVTVPVQGYHVSSSPTAKYFFYTVDVDAYVFPGSNKLSTNGTAILDTGRLLFILLHHYPAPKLC
jgi:hypothetical protein